MKLNLVLGWTWIVVGFGAGFVMGLNFHRAEWLGGYASHRRRLYRLAHIAFFGLAIVNLLFYFTARQLPDVTTRTCVASWGLAVGAVSMPLCCVVMAHRPQWRALFLIPVASLITGGLITLLEVIEL